MAGRASNRPRSTPTTSSRSPSTGPVPTNISARSTRTWSGRSSSNRRREESSAWHRARRAGGGRQAQRQAAPRADREIGESLRLERVAVPADRLDRPQRDAQQAGERAHQRRVVSAAAANEEFARRQREMRTRGGDRGGGHLGQGSGAVRRR